MADDTTPPPEPQPTGQPEGSHSQPPERQPTGQPKGKRPDMNRADVIDQYMPIVLFLVLNNTVGLVAAIVAMTLWAVKAQVSRYRRGVPLGRAMPIFVAYLVVRGTLGIIYDSEEVYFGIGISVKALGALVLLGSAAWRRNAAGYALPYLLSIDSDVKSHPVYRTTTRRITVAVALGLLASAGFDAWLLQNASINEFVLIRMGVNWGTTTFGLLLIGLYLERRFRRIPAYPGLMELLERRLEELGVSLAHRYR